ncbi:MAG: heparinase II/III family protein [Sphaerochaeta sp.]|uniref:hypothetical protein n=1 Tax=Sphaerochaeta sp. TaxID=1972642 RepID=UPI003D133137
MKNLSEYKDRLPGLFTTYQSVPPAADRTFWQKMDGAYVPFLLEKAQQIIGQDIPLLNASTYRLFSQTGDRKTYEIPYFQRRKALGTLTLAYCLTGNQTYLSPVIDYIFAICEETTWCLPAHNSYSRDAEQLPFADASRPIIDLFSAETAATLSQVHALLASELDSISPNIARRIIDEVQKRVFSPYLSQHFWWMGNREEPMNNWTTWCTQNVLLSTFLLPTSQSFRYSAVIKALASLDCFLKDYGEDGCCSEGAQYFRHAGLCLYGALALLNTVSGNVFLPVFSEPKIRNMAAFIRHMHAQGPYYFNFADCSPMPGQCTAREYLFAEAVGDAQLMQFTVASARMRPLSERSLPDEINLTYRLLEVKHLHRLDADTLFLQPQDIYYPSVGIFISRDRTFALGVKAGGNNDSHNHNDTGSITVYKSGFPLLLDVGVGTYTKQTFSQDRYAIWTMRSLYHNLTNFPPFEQQAGVQFKSEILSMARDERTASIRLALEHTYPNDLGLESYVRTVTHHKGGNIVITETVAGPVHPILSLMVYLTPTVEGAIINLEGKAELRLQAESFSVAVESIPITDTRLREAWPTCLYRILISYEKELSFTIQ